MARIPRGSCVGLVFALLIWLTGCAEQPFAPPEAAAAASGAAAAPGQGTSAATDAAGTALDPEAVRREHATAALEDALARVVPFLGEPELAAGVETRFRELLTAVRDADLAATHDALEAAHLAVEAYGAGARDAAVQAPDLDAIRLSLLLARPALSPRAADGPATP